MSLSFDPNQDLYKTLGVGAEASADEIKKAYRRLAKRYHPDSTGGDKTKEARFKEVGTAYDVLGDADKRAQYDAMRAGPQMPPGFSGGGFPGGGFQGGFNIGDLFSQVFTGGGQPQADGMRYTVRRGGNGAGFNFDTDAGPRRHRRRTRTKPARKTPARRRVRASDGSLVTKKGNDIHSDVRVDIDQAVLGAVVEVTTLTGKAKIKVPPGTSSGAKLRLRGKGAIADDGTVGDHYVTVQIEVPKVVDDKAKKLLVQFMQRTRKKKP